MYSIVIPTYGIKGISMTDNLLNSISSFKNPNLDEIVVSDDGSDSDTIPGLISLKDKYKNVFKKIIPVFNTSYHSFSKTVNRGLETSNSNNDIVLLNNDMLALTSFEPFVEFMKEKQNNQNNTNLNKVGIIGAKLLYPNGTIQHTGVVRTQLLKLFRHIYKFRSSDYPPANIPKKYISVTGACQYINRGLINTIGFLDERYILSYEDTDYCLGAQSNGYDVWYIPDVVMTHYESVTRKDLFGYQNWKLFWNKWGSLYDNIKKNQGISDDNIDVKIVGGSGLVGALYMISKV